MKVLIKRNAHINGMGVLLANRCPYCFFHRPHLESNIEIDMTAYSTESFAAIVKCKICGLKGGRAYFGNLRFSVKLDAVKRAIKEWNERMYCYG